jgi:hypothetical protein
MGWLNEPKEDTTIIAGAPNNAIAASLVVNMDDTEAIIIERVSFFNDHWAAFNLCVTKFNNLPEIFRSHIGNLADFYLQPKKNNIVDNIRAYAQWVAWEAIEEIAIYAGKQQVRAKTIDKNDPDTMPPNSVMREIIDKTDTEIIRIIDEKYTEYYNLWWKYLLPSEKWTHTRDEFKALMKSIYTMYSNRN